MNPQAFAHLSQMLYRQSGLVLTADKDYLVESRLAPVARRLGMRDVDTLLECLQRPGSGPVATAVVEAMTTNETSFFRDGRPFVQFRDTVLPGLMQTRAGSRRLRIWSAACSTGQEPFSLAMILADLAGPLAGWQVEIVGTDISPQVLARADAALYSRFEVERGLSGHRLAEHFVREGAGWRLRPDIRGRVRFRAFNLLDDPRSLGPFDIVFCRNVLIYFDQPTKAAVLERIAGVLAADGILCLGGAETVLGVSERFAAAPGLPGYYRLAPPCRAAGSMASRRSAAEAAQRVADGTLRAGMKL